MKKPFPRILGLIICVCSLNRALAQNPPFFNVKSYGATGNGSTSDTSAINKAIIAANAAGGGTVTFPSGSYLSGSIHLSNDVTLYLSNGATILGASSGYDAPESNPYSQYQDSGHSHFHNALIWGDGVNNVGVMGPGKIDGNGHLSTSSTTPADKALSLKLCTGIIVSGVTITHGGHFGIFMDGCTNVVVTNAQILESSDRDGFNLIDSSHCTIINSTIEGSDDSMCLKNTYALGRKIGSSDIHVSGCTILSTGNNATQFGSESVGDWTDVTFSNCKLTAAGKAGIGITSQDGAVIDGVTYDNITISGCAAPIWMKLDHRTGGAPGTVPVGRIRNISINNVTASHATQGSHSYIPTINGYFDGSSTIIPIENVVLNNVNISTVGGSSSSGNNNEPANNQDWRPANYGSWPCFGWFLRFAQNICFTNCQSHFDNNDDRAAVVAEKSTNILFDTFVAEVGSSSPYDLRFTNTTGYDVINSQSTTGGALRIKSNGSTTAFIAPAPLFNPPGDSYSSPVSVTLNDISGTSMFYTTDGSTPTTSSTPYTGPIDVSSQTTIKAIASVSGMVDSAVNTAIYLFPSGGNSGGGDFSISASPSLQSVNANSSTTYTVTITASGGFTGTVTPSASGLPSGATASFNPSTVSGSGSTTLTVTTSSSTPANTYTLTITGNSGSLSHSTQVNLAVMDFTVSATPSSQTVAPGASTNYTVNVGTVNGFSGTVTFSASGLPSGATASFNPTSVNSLGSSTMTVTTSSSTPNGSSTIVVKGTSGNLANTANVTLNVGTGSQATNVVFEAENVAVTSSGASTSVQTDANSSNGKWIELAATATGQWMQFTTPTMLAGTYQLQMEWKGNNNRGQLALSVDGGSQLGNTLDQYSANQTYPTTNFGNVTFSATGAHTIRLTVTGKNGSSSGFLLSADKFSLIAQ